MNRTFSSHLCPICGGGLEIGTTVSTLNLGFGLLVVKNVPARICAQCGEEWIDDQTAGCIEKLVEETKQRRSEIEVLAF